jgi:hypothetical protein
MFGRKSQIKDLKAQLIVTRVLFGPVFAKLPPDKQRLAMLNNPRDLASSVSKAVAAGEGETARSMVEAAASTVPGGVTAEQWADIMHGAYAVLS